MHTHNVPPAPLRSLRGSLRSALRNPHSAWDGALFALSFSLYALTLAPSLLPADNGEFQLVAWKLGIAHPPGYPLYTLVGYLFTRFFASPAFGLNLFSAILASTTLVLVGRLYDLLEGRRSAWNMARNVRLGRWPDAVRWYTPARRRAWQRACV